MGEEERVLFLYGLRETVGGIQIRVIVTDMRIVYLQFQYRALLKVVINRGIWRSARQL